jgi:hypothetical protein
MKTDTLTGSNKMMRLANVAVFWNNIKYFYP